MERKEWISPITEDDVEALRRLTAYYLPTAPTGHGMKPGDIKAALWKAFVWGDHSVIGLLRRICDGVNQAVDRSVQELERYVDDTVSDLGGNEGFKSIQSVEKLKTVDRVDTYRITFTDDSYFDYEVENGKDGGKGDKGDPFTYEDFTEEQLAALKGEPFTYDDFTDEQLAALGFRISKTYTSISAMNNGFATDGVPINGFVLIDTGDVNDEDNAKLFVKLENRYLYLCDLSGAYGIQGVGIASVKQTTTSTASGGSNVVTVTLTNGNTYTFKVQNGKDGYTPKRGTDYYTDADKAEMVSAVIDALPVYNGEVTAV